MSRERFIDPGIWTSVQFMSLSHPARLLFIGLITTADDEGRGVASLAKLKASIFPADNSVTIERVAAWRAEISVQKLCRFYTDEGGNGRELYDIPTWKTWQKPRYIKASVIPPYDTDRQICTEPAQICTESADGCGVVWCGGVGSGVEGSETDAPARAKRASRKKKPKRTAATDALIAEIVKAWDSKIASLVGGKKAPPLPESAIGPLLGTWNNKLWLENGIETGDPSARMEVLARQIQRAKPTWVENLHFLNLMSVPARLTQLLSGQWADVKSVPSDNSYASMPIG